LNENEIDGVCGTHTRKHLLQARKPKKLTENVSANREMEHDPKKFYVEIRIASISVSPEIAYGIFTVCGSLFPHSCQGKCH